VGVQRIEPVKPISGHGSWLCDPRLARHRKLRRIVASKLIQNWSTEQVSEWLKRGYPNNESMRVSHKIPLTAVYLFRLEE
jgi:IS30 family transposase